VLAALGTAWITTSILDDLDLLEFNFSQAEMPHR
jgi:hypothetical protein